MTTTVHGRLTPTPPFDFAQSLSFIEGFSPTRDEQAIAELSLTKAVFVAGQVIVFRVVATGSVEQPTLDYTLWSDQTISSTVQNLADDRIAFFLSLHDDLLPFYAIGEQDPAFASVLARLRGYHQVKFLTPFENACWAVLTQRTPMPVARTLKEALIKAFGDSLEVAGETYSAFPEPAPVAAAEHNALVKLVGNERRATYLSAIAQAFSTTDEGWLRTAPTEEVIAWLRAIKGIGPWSAQFVALRGLGHVDFIPSGEERMLQAAARIYGTATDNAAIERIAAQYGSWQGYWAHYLRAAA